MMGIVACLQEMLHDWVLIDSGGAEQAGSSAVKGTTPSRGEGSHGRRSRAVPDCLQPLLSHNHLKMMLAPLQTYSLHWVRVTSYLCCSAASANYFESVGLGGQSMNMK